MSALICVSCHKNHQHILAFFLAIDFLSTESTFTMMVSISALKDTLILDRFNHRLFGSFLEADGRFISGLDTSPGVTCSFCLDCMPLATAVCWNWPLTRPCCEHYATFGLFMHRGNIPCPGIWAHDILVPYSHYRMTGARLADIAVVSTTSIRNIKWLEQILWF